MPQGGPGSLPPVDQDELPLAGRHALVTGGASGIGRATAIELGARGADVTVNHVGTPAAADEVADEIAAAGGTGVPMEADVSDETDVWGMFERAETRVGKPVDLLVNNAGVEASFELEDMPVEEWDRVLGVNLRGPFLCSREFVRRVPESARPATIVNVSSVHEEIPWPSFSHYCASKGGLKLFGETIARELAPRGIRVVAVAPGAILTPMNSELADDTQARRKVEAEIPWGRLGRPQEIAAAVAWLCTPEAEYVVGRTLFVDGGMTLYGNFD